MGSLGDFGVPREPNDEAFGYFGQVIRVHPDLSDLALFEFAAKGSSMDENTPDDQAIALVSELLRSLVHAEDYELLWSTARANRQSVADLLGVAEKLVEALTARPTQQPSDSSGGHITTPEKSVEGSSSPVARRLEARSRPDLALMVTLAEEHRASA